MGAGGLIPVVAAKIALDLRHIATYVRLIFAVIKVREGTPVKEASAHHGLPTLKEYTR